jgi:hypothetical protein
MRERRRLAVALPVALLLLEEKLGQEGRRPVLEAGLLEDVPGLPRPRGRPDSATSGRRQELRQGVVAAAAVAVAVAARVALRAEEQPE